MIFKWDHYSDQPYPIKDKEFKKNIRKKNIFEYISTLLTNMVFFPLAILAMPFFKSKKNIENKKFYSMGVDFKHGNIQKQLIDELGVKSVLIRFPLAHIDKIKEYLDFVKTYTNDDIEVVLNILQNRDHIENDTVLKINMNLVFKTFAPYVQKYQIGNAINRSKWGFFSIAEYMLWYQKIQELKNTKYPELLLMGSSVIDFEYHYTIRTLFNFLSIKFDIFTALLYVDRRGSPYNTQMFIFNTKQKISMLYSMVRLSPKVSNEIYITEVNWPLKGTAPYAPTSEYECVDEDTYSKYMFEYYDIARKTNKIDRIYWHQLIAPGYGLVDNRNGNIRKTKAFFTFKEMINNAE
jgi:hypothetical protein